MTDTPDILKKILDTKAEEVSRRKVRTPIADLESFAESVEKPRGFYRALHGRVALKKPAIIAEIKKASPSKGVIR
ncbi:MAG: indole-3-glycerol-phosphate synthase TrpC, partial [Methylococcaceae bacterium]|nr:indole-3-glycerol-phosphate synthase TrpC [Methylococcaceae bacterium]